MPPQPPQGGRYDTMEEQTMKRLAVLLLLALALNSLGGCCVVREENRYAARLVEKTMWPQSTWARVAVTPVVGPIWVVGLAADALVINPVLKLPKAFFTALMLNSLVPSVPVVELVVFPLRIVALPLVTIGADLVYCMTPS